MGQVVSNGTLDRSGMMRVALILFGVSVSMAIFGRAAIAITIAPGFLLLLAVAGISSLRDGLAKVWHHPAAKLGLVTTVIALLLTPMSLDPWKSVETIIRTSSLIYSGALVAVLVAARPMREAVLLRRTLLVSVSLSFLFILASWHIAGEPLWPLSLRVHDVRTAFKAYSSVVACLLPVLIWLGTIEQGRWRMLSGVAVVLGIGCLVGNFGEMSRSGLAGAVGAVMVVALLMLISRFPQSLRLALLAGIAVTACMGFLVIAHKLSLAVQAGAYGTVLPDYLLDTHRQTIWGFTWSKFLEHPLLGWGVNASNEIAGARVKIPGLNQEFIPSHPHNFFLEFLVELGAPLTFLLTLCCLLIFLGLLRKAWRGESAAWAGIGLMAAFWIAALSNFSIWSYWWLLVVNLLGIVVASHLCRPQHELAA